MPLSFSYLTLCTNNDRYHGKHALFHGNIKTDYFLPWAFLGFIVEVLHRVVDLEELVKLGNPLAALGHANVLTAAAVITAFAAPTMNSRKFFQYVTEKAQ